MTPSERPHCAVQVDMDSFATMLQYYGHQDGPPAIEFYDLVVPRLLELFARYGVHATFFVVGADARGEAGSWLPRILEAGHEVGNHSDTHVFNLSHLSIEEQEVEVVRAEEAIAQQIGQRPVGFRSPGYDVNESLLDLLEKRGYWYDSSVFPSVVGPAARVYQRIIRLRHAVQRCTFGRAALVLAPRVPYRPSARCLWRTDSSRKLVELPVGTLPFLRLPFHATAQTAWGAAYFACGWPWVGQGDFVFAMHGVDVLGPDRDAIDPRLLLQPGVGRSSQDKARLWKRVFDAFAKRYTFVTSRDLAAAHGAGETSHATEPVEHVAGASHGR